ncbi:hypothetical protein J1N35_041492 [Gossypium stocksii]|uniref:Reverse transcriptase zinc-binding domain-containing protein n=1 Tax=Gossypium stocksii TaxID=47602 RepID=A0A9D3ZJS0_9ROSI|nr:hypothetical protein J1N35_041492 [Gossypium stocksii]
MVKEEGLWNLELFRVWLLEDLMEQFTIIPPPHHLASPNRIAWMGTSLGSFSIKSSYRKIEESLWNLRDVWKVEAPQRVRVLLWLALKQWFLTQVERLRRGLSNDSSCLVCGHEMEDVLHALRDCHVWKNIWKNQNISTFQEVQWNVEKIAKGMHSWAKQYISAYNGGSFARHILREEKVKTKRWIQLRSDGVAKVNTSCATVGEVLRDHNRKWVVGFNCKLRKCSVFEYELWGFLMVWHWYKEDNMIKF